MSHDLYTYGSTDPIYFKITLAGVGVNVTLATNDVRLSQDGASGGSIIDITSECAAVDGTNLPGLYKWTPNPASRTQCGVMAIYIKDASAGGAFDENCLVISTGGNASARFSG